MLATPLEAVPPCSETRRRDVALYLRLREARLARKPEPARPGTPALLPEGGRSGWGDRE